MSHPIASQWHTPSPYEFPRTALPLNPPETDPDYPGMYQPLDPMKGESSYLHLAHPPYGPQDSATKPQRVSTLAYHHAGGQEARDKWTLKSTKTLVVVVPPPDFLHEHAQLGHSSLFGPQNRLHQGILMPLCPTMYAQLTAIAREFNFPSIVGLCIYLHIVEDGVTMTPRILDDAWQYLWAHLTEPFTRANKRMPIGGRIEFDIDLDKARWYNTWSTSCHRVGPDTGIPISSCHGTSMNHERGDSRTTVACANEPLNGSTRQPPQSTKNSRHLPRKLSLVDRLDKSNKFGVSQPSRSVTSPPTSDHRTLLLPPITQEDEPKTTKLALRKRVDSWRATSSGSSLSLTKNAQTSEPARMSNPSPLDYICHGPSSEVNVDEYTCSVSSADPADCAIDVQISDIRLPSAHLMQSKESSIRVTPSMPPSYGPINYNLPSYATGVPNLPSPSFEQGMEDNVPSSSVATSWGPQSASVVMEHRSPLEQQRVFNRSEAPSIATSWGPQLSPNSPARGHERGSSIVLAQRYSDDLPTSLSIATSWGPPLSYPPSPIQSPTHSADLDECAFQTTSKKYSILDTHPDALEEISSLVSPYKATFKYTGIQESGSQTPDIPFNTILAHMAPDYPQFDIYPAEYPNFDLYPAVVNALECTKASLPESPPTSSPGPQVSSSDASAKPFQIVSAVSKVHENSGVIKIQAVYPMFDIYPAIYPWNLNEIYTPGIKTECSTPLHSSSSAELYAEPLLSASRDITPLVGFNNEPYVSLSFGYPNFDIYPQHMQHCGVSPLEIDHNKPPGASVLYPAFCLYPTMYPYFDLYPTVAGDLQTPVLDKFLQTLKLDLCNDFAAIAHQTSSDPPHRLGSDVSRNASRANSNSLFVREKLSASYPAMDIYAPVYPYIEPYPPQVCSGIRLAEFERFPTRNASKDILVADTVPHARNSAETGGYVLLASIASMDEELRPLATPSLSGTTHLTAEARSSSTSPLTSPKNIHRPRSEYITGESIRSIPSNRLATHCDVLKRFSTIPVPSSSGRGLTVPIRQRIDVVRSLPPVEEKGISSNGRPKTRSSTGSAVPLRRQMIESFGSVLQRSDSITSERPPVRRRDSLVWQKAQVFDEKNSKTESYDTPTRITLETLSKFPMPPKPSKPCVPQKFNRSRVPLA